MKIGLFGCGAYGIAISSILSENKCDITMWTKFEAEKESLEKTRVNERLMPNYKIPEDVKFTTSVKECIKDKDLLIVAIPAAFVDDLAKAMKPYIKDNHMNTLFVLPLAMIGMWEVVIIALVVLLLFGGKKIPELMKGLGKGVKSFKEGVNEAKEEINKAKDEIKEDVEK